MSRAGNETLEEALFMMFDAERDVALRSQLRTLLSALLTALAPLQPTRWIQLCKRLIQATARTTVKTHEINIKANPDDDDDDEEEEEPVDDDAAQHDEANAGGSVVVPRWWTKLFSMRCVAQVLHVVATSEPGQARAHWDLATARAQGSGADLLILNLTDLLNVAFNAATSTIAPMRPRGVRLLRVVVERFASAVDPDYEGHTLLEQFAAQIASSLRSAFEPDAPPTLTAAAAPVLAT